MRNTLRTFSLVLFFVFLALAIGGGLFWANLQFIRTAPPGADFLALWKPSQNLLMQGLTPYDASNALQLQRMIYGRAAHGGEQSYPFNLPLYVILLFLPVGWIRDAAIARAIWMLLLEAASVGLVFLSALLGRWKPVWILFALVTLAGLFWVPAVLSILNGNFIIFQALFVFGAIRALEQEADELAGGLLALALVQISVTGLSILVIAIWVMAASRWRVLAGFLMTLTFLGALSFLVMPSWFIDFFFSVLRTWRAQLFPSTFSMLEGWFPGIGVQLGQGVRAIAIIILFFEWQAVRGKGTLWLFWTTALTAVLTPFFGMQFASAWLAFTLPALLLVFSVMGQRWGILGALMSFLLLAGMSAGLWAAYLSGLEAVFIFVYPLAMAVMLYWVRWWVTRPPRLWIDMASKGG